MRENVGILNRHAVIYFHFNNYDSHGHYLAKEGERFPYFGRYNFKFQSKRVRISSV